MVPMDQERQDDQVCPTCFATTKFPGTVIEPNGRCRHCNSHEFEEELKQQTTSDLSELRSIAAKLKQRSPGKYDCVIGASGGFDSSYIIYVAKKLLDLNPLVVKYDHGFNHEIADLNVQTICKNLNVDLKYTRSKKQNDLKFIKYVVWAFKDLDLYWGICKFCSHAGGSVVLKAALDNNIPVILEAVNKYEKNNFLSGRVKFKIVLKRLSKINPLKWPRIPFYLLIANYYLLKFRLELFVPPVGNIFKPFPRSKKVEKLYLSKYLKWDIYSIAKILEKETGWKCPHPEMPMRFDCQIEDSFFNYTWKKATGNTTHTIICNNLIYANIKMKDELAAVVDYHDRILDRRMKEMRERLKLR